MVAPGGHARASLRHREEGKGETGTAQFLVFSFEFLVIGAGQGDRDGWGVLPAIGQRRSADAELELGDPRIGGADIFSADAMAPGRIEYWKGDFGEHSRVSDLRCW